MFRRSFRSGRNTQPSWQRGANVTQHRPIRLLDDREEGSMTEWRSTYGHGITAKDNYSNIPPHHFYPTSHREPTDDNSSRSSPSRLNRLLHKTLQWGGTTRSADNVCSSASFRTHSEDRTSTPKSASAGINHSNDGDNTPSGSLKNVGSSNLRSNGGTCNSSCSHCSSSTTASGVSKPDISEHRASSGIALLPAAFVDLNRARNRTEDSKDENGSSELNVLEDLFSLLGSSDATVRDRTLATIFSLAQSSCTSRNRILEAGGLQPILKEIQRDGPANLGTARALFHLTTGPVKAPFVLVQQALSSIQRLLVTSEEAEVLIIVCYILDEITRDEPIGSSAFITQVLPSPFHPRTADLLFHESLDVRYRALRLINSIALADRISEGKDSESQFEPLVWAELVKGLELALRQSELQNITLEILQNLMVYRLERLVQCKELTRQYFSKVKDRIGFESKIVASLCAVAQKASQEEMQFLRSCGCSEVVDKCSADMKLMNEYKTQLLQLQQRPSTAHP